MKVPLVVLVHDGAIVVIHSTGLLQSFSF